VSPQGLDEIAEAPARRLLETLRGQLDGRVASAGIVGHEPGLNELASLLVAGDEAAVAFEWRRGAVAIIDLEAFEPGMGTLDAFLPPRVLRAAARATTAASG
jgi:phosphohistidine phosphatase SixA